MGAVTDSSSPLRRGAVRGAFSVGAVVLGLSSPRKASWISYDWCRDYSYKSNSVRTTEKFFLV